MGANDRSSWDEGKRERNITNHGYDFADLAVVFDGRFCLTRLDTRFDYGEARFNMLVAFEARILNITFTMRGSRYHLISARPASRQERMVYDGKNIRK
jgi:uncharacterized protein